MSYKKNDASIGPVWIVPEENNLTPEICADKYGFLSYSPRIKTPTSKRKAVLEIVGVLVIIPFIATLILWGLIVLSNSNI